MASKYHAVPCAGAAHSNPHIDNCGLCAPLWGRVVVPVAFPSLQAFRDSLDDLSDEDRRKAWKGPRQAAHLLSNREARARWEEGKARRGA